MTSVGGRRRLAFGAACTPTASADPVECNTPLSPPTPRNRTSRSIPLATATRSSRLRPAPAVPICRDARHDVAVIYGILHRDGRLDAYVPNDRQTGMPSR